MMLWLRKCSFAPNRPRWRRFVGFLEAVGLDASASSADQDVAEHLQIVPIAGVLHHPRRLKFFSDFLVRKAENAERAGSVEDVRPWHPKCDGTESFKLPDRVFAWTRKLGRNLERLRQFRRRSRQASTHLGSVAASVRPVMQAARSSPGRRLRQTDHRPSIFLKTNGSSSNSGYPFIQEPEECLAGIREHDLLFLLTGQGKHPIRSTPASFDLSLQTLRKDFVTDSRTKWVIL